MCPLTAKGEGILSNMEETYGSEKKAKQVLYASENAGKITGIHDGAMLDAADVERIDKALRNAVQSLTNSVIDAHARWDAFVARQRDPAYFPMQDDAKKDADEKKDKPSAGEDFEAAMEQAEEYGRNAQAVVERLKKNDEDVEKAKVALGR